MADGVQIDAGSGPKIAAREVPYSGETQQMQAVGIATFEGADDAKVATDISRDNPLPVSDEDVARLLVRVLNLLGAPVNYDPALNRQRMTAILESGTLTALTTVGAVTDITNFGAGRTASELQNNQSLAAWAACHASRVF
jgi:hypothetical protein